ncbi:MAG: Lrp/AsnC family transcriptional regulator [Hydrogenophilales bacterium]|nr:Lrp/AsnC family transcriptional regulator [Hydrogenophilales bacterium]
MDSLDRRIINALQGGFPLSERPYAEAAAQLGATEEELMQRIDALLDNNVLTRFGPMFHAERMGGAFSLAAMKIPDADFERVAGIVNRFPEVAHNYARDHAFNMWFVLGTETPSRVTSVIEEIEHQTGYPVYNMPKLEEFFVGLRFEA